MNLGCNPVYFICKVIRPNVNLIKMKALILSWHRLLANFEQYRITPIVYQ